MYRTQGVLALLALCVGLVSSFSWDIVVARSNRLEFYNEGMLVHMATPASQRIKWITYDAVHDRVLFNEIRNREDSVSSFDIANQTTQSLVKKKTNQYLKRFAYDPATELLFGTVTKSIYSFPLGPGNSEVDGDLVITLQTVPREVAVDSCGGFVYWTTNNIIERALFNGSEREVIIENNATLRQGLTIDTQKIYWIESQEFSDGGFSIQSADLNGKNRKTLYRDTESDSTPDKLTVSKDFISWGDSIEKIFWQLSKHPSNDIDLKPNKIAMNTTIFACVSHDIAGNYKIEERTQRVPKCHALSSLLPDYHVCLKASAFCVHGTKVIGESRCDCVEGYIGERCDLSVCENYCLQGDCNISAEGQPTCRCNAGYTGMRCEVSACYKHCLNNGTCSLNADDEAMCQCTGQYEGERCEILKTGLPSDADETTATKDHTMKITTASNTDLEYNMTTTETPTTPQANIESTINKSSVFPSSLPSDADEKTVTKDHTMKATTASYTDFEYNMTTTETPTTPQANIESTTNKSSVFPSSLLSDDDKTTIKNHTMKTTTTSNTDLEYNVTNTTTTKTPTTPQSTTKKSSVVPTSLLSDADEKTTTKNHIMKTATISNTDLEYNVTTTITTETPTTSQSTTKKSSVVPTTLPTPNEGFHWLPMVGGKLPPNAIIGGSENGNVYIARANLSGSLTPGKYVKSSGIAYFPWGGKEHIKENFEILCGHNAKWVKTSYDNIPKNAFIGGLSERNSDPLYICRDKIDDRLICGKVHGYYKKCYLSYKGVEKELYSYEILVEE